jgi:hypothetical protein
MIKGSNASSHRTAATGYLFPLMATGRPFGVLLEQTVSDECYFLDLLSSTTPIRITA